MSRGGLHQCRGSRIVFVSSGIMPYGVCSEKCSDHLFGPGSEFRISLSVKKIYLYIRVTARRWQTRDGETGKYGNIAPKKIIYDRTGHNSDMCFTCYFLLDKLGFVFIHPFDDVLVGIGELYKLSTWNITYLVFFNEPLLYNVLL